MSEGDFFKNAAARAISHGDFREIETASHLAKYDGGGRWRVRNHSGAANFEWITYGSRPEVQARLEAFTREQTTLRKKKTDRLRRVADALRANVGGRRLARAMSESEGE